METLESPVVLVVDDYRDVAEGLVRLLRIGGHDALAVSCGDELFAHLESTPATLIILDLHMPDADGITCLRRLRAEERWRDIPVIIHSADDRPSLKKRALAAGAKDYLVKGARSWKELQTLIEQHVQS